MQALTFDHSGAARPLVRYPALWATAAVIGVNMGMFTGARIALVALVALVALGAAVGVVCAALRNRRVCEWLEGSARRESLRARREDREIRLQEAGVRVQGLAAATVLVDRITALDPWLATHLELDALLDRYVVLELATARCACLLAERYGAHTVPEGAMARTRIRVRSATLRQACEMRLATLQDELASIVEFFQLLLQRSALEATERKTDPLGERMALLDGALPG